MNKYVVLVKSMYTSVSIAGNDYIADDCDDKIEGSYDWFDAEGEFFVGVYVAESREEAINTAANSFNIDPRALYTVDM